MAFLSRLKSLLDGLEKRIAGHDTVLKRHSKAISQLQEKTGGLERVQAGLIFSKFHPIIQVPPFIKDASKRKHSVDSLVAIVRQHTWTAIHGPSGTGKTQLAILISQVLGRCSAWVRLSSTPEQSQLNIQVLERSLELASRCAIKADRREWYDTLCDRFGESALIVLDDVPRIHSNDPLGESVVLLCQACRRHNVYLLTTSPHSLLHSITDQLEKDIVFLKEVPLLSNQEAGEILVAHGASQEFLRPKRLSFINLICQQYPALVVAAARYLKEREWKFSDKEFSDLLRSKHTNLLNQDTLNRLISTVANAESRDLLERLTLISYRFEDDEVRTVAEVCPSIMRPFDRLNPLLGLWIYYDAKNSYLVSPLARSLGPINLPKNVKKLVNLNLGENILRRKELNQIDLGNVLIYFCGAEAWDRAGQVLFRALLAIQEHGIPQYDAGLLDFWADLPLPSGMNLGLRISIRGLQVSLGAKADKKLNFLIQDLDSLCALASDNESCAVFTASLNVATAFAGRDPEITFRYLDRAFNLLSTMEQHTDMLGLLKQLQLESLIWIAAWHLSDARHIYQWLDTAAKMPSWLLERAHSSELAEGGCISISSEIWLREAEKDRDSQSWPAVRTTLASLASRALQLGQELLWASSVRSQVIVLAEYENLFEEAIRFGIEALKVTKDPRCRFMIEDCIARQHLSKKNIKEAMTWFFKALEEPSDAFPLLRMQSYANASIALADKKYELAIELLHKAIKIGLSHEDIPRTELVKVMGELCVLHGLRSDLLTAYSTLDAAVVQLMSEKTFTTQWQGVFTVLGHLSGYFTSIACWGHPPNKTDNEEPYATPMRGMFLGYDELRCAALYDEAKECAIYVQLAQYAEAIGLTDRAEYWAFSGMEAARKSKYAMGIEVLSLQIVPLLILRNQISDALALAVESAAITVACIKERDRGGKTTKAGFDYELVLGPKPNANWDEAEINAIIFGLLPATCKIMAEYLSSPENAVRLAQDAISASEQLAQTASHIDLWKQATIILKGVFLTRIPGHKIIDFCNNLDQKKYGWLRFVGFVGASIQSDCRLSDACQIHIELMSVYYNHFRSLSRATYHKVLVPFITTFWQQAFQKQRFRFSSPSHVAEELDKAFEASESRRAQQVLKTVAWGLGIRLSYQSQEWLRGNPDRSAPQNSNHPEC
jgi:tetratricopeptide (TPR) repeat protein